MHVIGEEEDMFPDMSAANEVQVEFEAMHSTSNNPDVDDQQALADVLEAKDADGNLDNLPAEGNVVEEGQVAKLLRQPYEPTAQERAEHEKTHIPYRPWCSHCVRGKGRNLWHQ